MLLFLDALLALLATLFLVYLTVVCVLSLLPCPQRSPGGAARAQWAARGGSCGARAAVYTLGLKAASGVATGVAYLPLLCSAPELHDFPRPCSRSRAQIAPREIWHPRVTVTGVGEDVMCRVKISFGVEIHAHLPPCHPKEP